MLTSYIFVIIILIYHVKIVPKGSACLEGYCICPIRVDHLSMCRFDEEDDKSYLSISGVLQGWVTEPGKGITIYSLAN